MSLINFNSPSNNPVRSLTRNLQISVSNTLSQVLAAGFLNGLVDANSNPVLEAVDGTYINPLNNGGNGMILNTGDFLFIAYTGGQGVFQVSSVSSNLVTLALMVNPNQLYSQVALTLAQFLANYGTPALVIPAQGANTMIIVNSMQIVQNYGSAALAGGGAVTPQYGNTADGAGVAAGTSVAAADFQQTASAVYPIIGVSGSGKYLLDSSCANQGIYLSNPTAVFTAGTGSTFIVKSLYEVISTNS